MKIDSKLSSVLHLLLHMAHSQQPMTSEALAACLQGSPVVVRRTLAGLREAGFVSSEKGHGGGWVLACNLKSVTLRDVYDAVGAPTVFAMGHRSDQPECLVEQAVNHALSGALLDAQALLIQRLARVTLADLAAHPPKDQDGLGRVRGLSATWKSNDIGGRLMEALAGAQPLAKEDMPDRAPRGPGLGMTWNEDVVARCLVA